MAHFYYVRHGETVWNKEDKVCGRTDSPLTELGHQQAVEAGLMIKNKGIHIDEILHSPLSRARDTAKHIADILDVPMRPEPRLIERDFGKWEGTSPRNDPGFIASKEYFADTSEGGESTLKIAQRIYNLIDEIMAEEDKVYLLVAHGSIFRVVQAYFTSMSNSEFAKTAINNGEVRRLGD